MARAAWLLSALFILPSASAQQTAPTVDEFLMREAGFTREQLAAVARGEVIAKLVPTSNERDVTTFGVVRVDVTRAFFETHHTDFERSLQTATRDRLGVFGQPATLADVQGIQVTPDDFKELRECRPNDCSQKVPAADMAALRSSIDWSARDAPAKITEYVRQRVIGYVNDYRKRGNAAMVDYADRGNVQSSVAFADMLSDETYLYRYVPSFQKHLLEYPNSTLPGAKEAIYWSADELPKMRPVLKIAHQIVYSPAELPGTTLTAGKLIYANHYFEAGLELLTAIDRPAVAGERGITLLLVRRYRFDQLPGGLLNIRGRVSNAVRDLAQADLTRYKTDYEQAFARGGPGG